MELQALANKFFWLMVTTGSFSLLNCGGDKSAETPSLSKDQVNASKADTSAISRMCRQYGQPSDCDLCELMAWYSDGECDSFCPQPDSDCQVPEYVGCKKDSECFSMAGAYCLVFTPTNPEWPGYGECVWRDGWSCTDNSHCGPRMNCVPDCGMGKCGGMCAPIEGCKNDTECDVNQICAVSFSNVTGLAQGECRNRGEGFCNVDADCGQEKFCTPTCGAGTCFGECQSGSCTQDTDCLMAAGAFCLIHHPDDDPPREPWGECVLLDGNACTNGSHCAPKMQCVSDCGTTDCIGMCVAGDGCKVDTDCGGNQGCYFSCSLQSLTCTGECKEKDQSICNIDSDCAESKKCSESCGMGKCWGECR